MARPSGVSYGFGSFLRASASAAALTLGLSTLPAHANAPSTLNDRELDQITAGAVDLDALLQSNALDLSTLLSALSDLAAIKASDPTGSGKVDVCASSSSCTSTSLSLSTGEPGAAASTLTLPVESTPALGEPASSLSTSSSVSPGTGLQITIPESVLQSLMGLPL